jgi:hypothetical protein
MAGTNNTISSLIAQFLRLQANSLEIINGLNEVATSTNQTVTIQVLDENGLPNTVNIPSYGYMSGEIQRLDNNIRSLAGLSDTFATVRNPDGTYSQVYKYKTLKEPERITNLPVPSTFQVKDNWFFESFLSPLLYVSVNVTGKIPDNTDRVVVKRIIANITNQFQRTIFNSQLNGRNDISHDGFIAALESNGISYFTDESVVDLPLRKIRYVGNFGVTNYIDDSVIEKDAAGNSVQTTVRNYKLTTLTYTDTTSNVTDGEILKNKDVLTTEDGTRYAVVSVNVSDSTVQLRRISGYQTIPLGSNSLTISSTNLGQRYVDVNVGYNERQGVFFKTIDDDFNVVGAVWSTGIIFSSNDLETTTTDGEVVTLGTYYNQSVSDFGNLFIGLAKEKTIPAINGLTPNIPSTTQDSFKVVQVNKQVTDSVSIKNIDDKLKLKTSTKSEIDSIDQAIQQTKLQISNLNSGKTSGNGSAFSTFTDQKSSLENNLKSLTQERSNKSELYASLVNEITTLTQDVPQLSEKPKYRVRGFWPIPNPKFEGESKQEVIQFNVRYRYLSDSGSSQPSEQIEYTDLDGLKKNAAFSNWVEFKTPERKKIYDSNKGYYVWADEDPSNSDAVNINQLDIPITKGEKVEIQIASISEAGWPQNPLTSDFSPSVIVSFPDNLSVNGSSETLLKNNEDSAVVKVQQTLNSQGLPQHLSEQFTDGNIIYYHNSTNIASGFYTTTGGVISLFEKISQLQNQIDVLKSLITVTKGILEVYIVDSNNQKIQVSKGSLVSLNAGFYSDIFTNPLTNDAGKVVSVSYKIQITNSQATPVELASIIPGGLAVKAPNVISASSPVGYNENLRYGQTPISISSLGIPNVSGNTSFRQIPTFASASAYSQYLYPRFKNIGLDEILYCAVDNNVSTNTPSGDIPAAPTIPGAFTALYNPTYVYDGSTQTNFTVTGTYPQNGTVLTPYDPSNTPTVAKGATSSGVWDGTYSASTGGTPNGGGEISEFCISNSHPYLTEIGQSYSYSTYPDLVKPYSSDTKAYPPFRHTQTFWADTSLNDYKVQQGYRDPITFAAGPTANREDRMYPDKLGFSSNDEYLIGKFSCGSYLFLSPVDSSFLQVPGINALSTVSVSSGESSAINVPLIFQFRAVDKLGYIGGFRKSGNLSNITYTKKIGVDIQIKNEDSFSFDVEVSGSYKNESLVAPNFDSAVVSNV